MIKKKRKKTYSSSNEDDGDEQPSEDLYGKHEEDGEEGMQPKTTDESNLYKVIGQKTFTDLKKISVTSKWIAAGLTFSADLTKEHLSKLKTVQGLHPRLMESVKKNVRRWFPVQNAVLPHLIHESNFPPMLPPRDVAICAPTGSGKTLCYLLPIINSLSAVINCRSVFALIVAPVQNLVVQIENEFKKFDPFNIPTAVLCGSHDPATERRQLQGAAVVFATPGRLIERLVDPQNVLDVSRLRYLIIDEADRMLSNARIEWLDTLETASNLSGNWSCAEDLFEGRHLQKILVSATLSRDVEKLHVWRLRYPRLFRASATSVQEVEQKESLINSDHIAGAVILPSSLKHEVLVCESKLKPLAVHVKIAKQEEWNRILVFVNSRLASKRLAILLKLLSEGRYNVEELSSNLFGRRRQKVLTRFKKGSTRVLISSDVLSRGVDVQDIDAVVNYDKPQTERLYIHRVGRTARCGKEGTAISVTTPDEKQELEKILKGVLCWEDVEETTFKGDEDDSLSEKYKTALAALKEALEHPKVKKELKSGDARGRKQLRKRKSYPS